MGKCFDSIICNNKYFFVGERHDFKRENQSIQRYFIANIFKTIETDTLYVLCEYSYSFIWGVNYYINNNDENGLKKYWNSGSARKSDMDFFLWLNNMNQKSNSSKIQLIGIDVEDIYAYTIKTLQLLLPVDLKVPENDIIKQMKVIGIEYSSDTKLIQYLSAFSKDFNKNESYYQLVFKNNFKIVKNIFRSFNDNINSFYNPLDSSIFSIRETIISGNIISAIQTHPNNKFFGQLGRYHISSFTREKFKEERVALHDAIVFLGIEKKSLVFLCFKSNEINFYFTKSMNKEFNLFIKSVKEFFAFVEAGLLGLSNKDFNYCIFF